MREMVREARRQRRIVDGGLTDWIVVRNRLSLLGSRNKQAGRRGPQRARPAARFPLADGFSERVVYREFFPRGLTALDNMDEATLGTRPNLSHVTARQEVASLIDTLKLPLDERGQRRAAARAEWFAARTSRSKSTTSSPNRPTVICRTIAPAPQMPTYEADIGRVRCIDSERALWQWQRPLRRRPARRGNRSEPRRRRARRSTRSLSARRTLAPPVEPGQRGRLIFALDATMSRQPTWDTACRLQADMFREAAAIGGLDVQLVYYRGLAECRASRWVSDARRLAGLMEKIDCRGGHTQIGACSPMPGARPRRRRCRRWSSSAMRWRRRSTIWRARRRARPARRSGLHVPGGPRPGRRAGVSRDRAAHARRLLPLRLSAPRTSSASCCGRRRSMRRAA